jgi:hypothetical protein
MILSLFYKITIILFSTALVASLLLAISIGLNKLLIEPIKHLIKTSKKEIK